VPDHWGCLIRRADVVTINCPLHEGTRGMFDKALMSTMKQGSYLVNTARCAPAAGCMHAQKRGAVVDACAPSGSADELHAPRWAMQTSCKHMLAWQMSCMHLRTSCRHLGGAGDELHAHSGVASELHEKAGVNDVWTADVCRGAIVNRDDVVEMLKSGHLAGYAGGRQPHLALALAACRCPCPSYAPVSVQSSCSCQLPCRQPTCSALCLPRMRAVHHLIAGPVPRCRRRQSFLAAKR
jgi:hypothetical protein